MNCVYKDCDLYSTIDAEKHYQKHLARLRTINQLKPNPPLADKILSLSRFQKSTSSEFKNKMAKHHIQNQNSRLLQKLIDISSRFIDNSPTPHSDSSMHHKYLNDRITRDTKIQCQNVQINQRLISQSPTLSTSNLERSFRQAQEYKVRIVKYKHDGNKIYMRGRRLHDKYVQKKEKEE